MQATPTSTMSSGQGPSTAGGPLEATLDGVVVATRELVEAVVAKAVVGSVVGAAAGGAPGGGATAGDGSLSAVAASSLPIGIAGLQAGSSSKSQRHIRERIVQRRVEVAGGFDTLRHQA